MAKSKTNNPTELVKWKPTAKELINRYLQHLMDSFTVDSDGTITYTDGGFFYADLYFNILSHHIDIPHFSNVEVKSNLIKESAARLKIARKQDLHIFRNILASKVRQYLNLPTQKYRILFPLNV